MRTRKALGRDDMPVVFKAPSVEKVFTLKRGSSSRFTILCLVAIVLVIRMNKHYIHAGLLPGPGILRSLYSTPTSVAPSLSLGCAHFSGPPHFRVLEDFFENFLGKFGVCSPKFA